MLDHWPLFSSLLGLLGRRFIPSSPLSACKSRCAPPSRFFSSVFSAAGSGRRRASKASVPPNFERYSQKGRAGDPTLASDLLHRLAGFGPLEEANDLFPGEHAFPMSALLRWLTPF